MLSKQDLDAARITPAGAGKTVTSLLRHNRFKDHPRRCGENTVMCSDGKFDVGSPPQVRGKRVQESKEACKNRITPAGAGKTDSVFAVGDNRAGSPPQVRGKRQAGHNGAD